MLTLSRIRDVNNFDTFDLNINSGHFSRYAFMNNFAALRGFFLDVERDVPNEGRAKLMHSRTKNVDREKSLSKAPRLA